MRAIEIAIFLIVLQASVGFVSGLDLFSTGLDAGDNQFSAYGDDTQWDAASETETSDSIMDYATITAKMTIGALQKIVGILSAIFVIYPVLVTTFMIPAPVAAILQVMIYAIYGIAYIEYRRGMDIF